MYIYMFKKNYIVRDVQVDSEKFSVCYFNDISTFSSYLMPNPSIEKDRSSTI